MSDETKAPPTQDELAELELRAIITALPRLLENTAFLAIISDAEYRANALAQSNAHADLAPYALGYIAAVNDFKAAPHGFKLRALTFGSASVIDDGKPKPDARENHGAPQPIN